MPTFTVIDDSPEFIDSLRTLWDKFLQHRYKDWKAYFIYIDPLSDDDSFIASLKLHEDADHILVDATLVDQERVQLICRSVGNAKIWMCTGDFEKEVKNQWGNWCGQFPSLQLAWFEKPLNLEQLIATLLSSTEKGDNLKISEIIHDISEDPHNIGVSFKAIPLACRLFDNRFNPVEVNKYWLTAVDAFPNEFSEKEKKQLLDGYRVISSIVWCECPYKPGQYNQFRFFTCQQGDYYLQVAESIPDSWTKYSQEKTLDEIFSLMKDSGIFDRCRYYERIDVPSCDGVLKLLRANHPIKDTLPLSYPIGSTIGKRINDFEMAFEKNDIPSQQNLIYEIRKPTDDPIVEEADISFWNEAVTAGQSPWLEIPLFLSRVKDKHHKVVALLFFDRSGRKNDEADDNKGDEINEKMVKRLEPRFLEVMKYLRSTIKHEREVNALKNYQAYARWQMELSETAKQDAQQSPVLSKLEHIILSAAKSFTQVDSALLALRPPAADYLQVRDFDDQVMCDLRLPLNCPRFIAVRCAKERKAIFVPNFKALPPDEIITDEDWRTASYYCEGSDEEIDQRVKDCQDWTRSIGSVIALPVEYDEQLLGVLLLRHQEAYHFTAEKIEAAETLVRHIQPYLRHARMRVARDAWDTMIMHEVRTGLAHINNKVDELENPIAGQTDKQVLLQLFARNQEMVALTNQVMYLLGYKDKRIAESYDRTNPLQVLKSKWNTLAQLPEAINKALIIDPNLLDLPDNQSLHDPNYYFPQVLSVLLYNAIRHGKKGNIEVNAQIDAKNWTLLLKNPGQFSASIISCEFQNIQSREDLAQNSLRVHIGLTTVYRLIYDVGGQLKLYNENGLACVILSWPLTIVSINGD